MLQAHAHGIEFREWNAGEKIDGCMKDEGFNVRIAFDKDTGFCFGGNKSNCGTWMDKMGSSFKTNNRGIPATPRDGAPIELVAMQYSVLRFVHSLYE
jgi:glycogen debranching enzyme